MAGGIFINYRRAPNGKDAQLLQNALQRHFRWRRVFLDVRGFDAGVQWLHELQEQVDASAAMVALIGQGWPDVRDEKGNRRLEDPDDFVRFELARALSRRIPVLPVLIDGAAVPDKAQLPANLLELAYRQAEHLRRETFDDDAERIARTLRELIAQSRRRGLSYLAAGTAVVAALGLGVAAGPKLLTEVGLPLPGVILPHDKKLRADLDAAKADLAKAAREQAGRQARLAALEKQIEQSAAALTAATKARDDALARAKNAQSEADLAGDALANAIRERDVLRAELAAKSDTRGALADAQTKLAASRRQLDEATKARAEAVARAVAAADALAKVERERNALGAELAASQRQLDAITKARDEALGQAEGWQRKYAALDAQFKEAQGAAAAKKKTDEDGRTTPKSDEKRPGREFRDCADVCPVMVVVPAGKFIMGTNDYSRYERPPHKVEIERAFAVGKFEVTFDEWDACVAAVECVSNPRPPDNAWGRGRRPVINVSWNDAKEYVAWLSRKTGKMYRLLSEAEWEYAARVGTTTVFSWGDSIGKGNANCDGCGSQWDNKQTAPVGSFKPNAWGVHDMIGNVGEWVEDSWHDDYIGAPKDGSVRKGGSVNYRVQRGGTWYVTKGSLHIARRFWGSPGTRVNDVGFRIARTL